MPSEVILIVEDELLLAEELKMYLEGMGCRVMGVVRTGEEAIEGLKQFSPDLVLMDIVLAGSFDGISAAETIRARRDIPIVYLTAHSDPELLARACITEPFGYLLKPFDVRELRTTLTMALYKHQVDQRLRETEAQYRFLVENTFDILYACDAKGIITYVSPQVKRYAEEIIGRAVVDFVYPEDREKALTDLNRPLTQGEEFPSIFRLCDKAGNPVWIEERGKVRRDPEEKVMGLTGIFRDITETKRAEKALKKTVSEFERLVYIASHDLVEPIRQVASFSQLLKRRYKPHLDAEAAAYVTYIEEGATRIHDLVEGMCLYYGLLTESRSFQRVRLDEILTSVLNELQSAITVVGACIDVTSLPEIEGEPERFAWVFWHLLKNALCFRGKASPEIRITSRDGGKAWHLTVEDNGIGILAEHREAVFDLFRRLHPRERYPGRGLGLPIVRKVVEAYGGRVWIETGQKGGTAVHLTFPDERLVHRAHRGAGWRKKGEGKKISLRRGPMTGSVPSDTRDTLLNPAPIPMSPEGRMER